MAQYGYNFYGTSYYGKTNAFSGWYQTKEIFTDETLKDTVNISIRAVLPSASYKANDPEVKQLSGSWTYNDSSEVLSSNTPGATLQLSATSDSIGIKYQKRLTGAKVTIEVTTTEVGKDPVISTHLLDTASSDIDSDAVYEITGLPYGDQSVRIIVDSSNALDKYFYFKGFSARTTNITVESRSRLDDAPWPSPVAEAAYQKVELTATPISGATDEYMLHGTTPSYTGNNYIQLKIYLASSDNITTPEIKWVEMVAGDTNNRTATGQWSAIFDMKEIAVQAGVSFSKVEEIDWTEEVPSSTSLTLRSQSSSDKNNIWDKVTVPYKLGVNRIKLKDGYQTGWIDSPFISPASKRKYVTNLSWNSWEDQSFLPPDSAGTSVTYTFMDTQKSNFLNPYHKIVNPMNVANKNLSGTRLKNLDTILRINLKRTSGKQTPVVDFVKMTSNMRYEQNVEIKDQEFSAVDNNNTGKDIVLDTSQQSFKDKFIIPAETSNPTYSLHDETGRPQDLILYFDSEKDEAIRTNETATLDNAIWAEAKVQSSSSKTGLIKNYQYGGGQVRFPNQDKIEMAPAFTPSLKDGLRYKYYLLNGWPTQYHTTVAGDTFEKIAIDYVTTVSELIAANPNASFNNDGTLVAGQKIAIPNDSMNNDVNMFWQSTSSLYTKKSSHNAVIEGLENVESDSLIVEVKEASIYGWVDWVSEEKIYDGFVNLNDVRSEYKRTHISPDSGESAQITYIAIAGDTYKKIANRFGVYEVDVRKLNNASETDEPVVGQKVLVPARITLPEIHPKASVSDNPYHIDIVYNSVKKTDGKIINPSYLTVKPIEITYKKVTMQDVEVIRGDIENGKDLLNHPRVTEILMVQSLDKTMIYNQWDDVLGIGDYKKTDNYVDWSPATSAREPARGETYLVDYVVEVPDRVTVTIDTTYQEEGGVDRIWRSPEVKEFKGMCFPGQDFVQELPPFSEWKGLPDSTVEDIEYIVEDNDIWVKTWIEKEMISGLL
ncbi:LysM peptidoglycan-binding domain-containing protein [Bacillus stercoris]|nr:LysM peptidoglycan-binding domain-containing protein [Bacillus stercoris]